MSCLYLNNTIELNLTLLIIVIKSIKDIVYLTYLLESP